MAHFTRYILRQNLEGITRFQLLKLFGRVYVKRRFRQKNGRDVGKTPKQLTGPSIPAQFGQLREKLRPKDCRNADRIRVCRRHRCSTTIPPKINQFVKMFTGDQGLIATRHQNCPKSRPFVEFEADAHRRG